MKHIRLFLLVGLAVVVAVSISGCVQQDVTNLLPFATASPVEQQAPMEVTLDGTQSESSDGEIVSYSWVLGGSVTKEGPIVSYTFSQGVHTVELTVIDDQGNIRSTYLTVHALPNATFTADTYLHGELVTKHALEAEGTFGAGEQVIFEALDSGDDPNVTYSWDFGDGTVKEAGSTITHSFEDGDTYTITLTVTDSYGATDSCKETLTIIAGSCR